MLPSECLISCHDNRGEEEKEGERYREEMGEGEEEKGRRKRRKTLLLVSKGFPLSTY